MTAHPKAEDAPTEANLEAGPVANVLLAETLGVDVDSVPEGVMLVAFGAKWCIPWRALRRRLDELVEGGASVTIVDVDENPGLADSWGVIALPTVALIDGCRERRRWVGAVAPGELAAGESASGLNTGMRRRR